MVKLVRPLVAAGTPTFAVLGNHDYTSGGAELVREGLSAAGVRVLADDVVVLHPSSPAGVGQLHLVGLASTKADDPAPPPLSDRCPRALRGSSSWHHPRTFRQLPDHTAPFAVSGHTHGGQVQVPLVGWSLLDVVAPELPVEGWARGYGASSNRLYVSRGVGMSTVGVRFACPPELTIFTLSAA